MGLDMYAYRVDKKYKTPVITRDIEDAEEIFYWRKNRFMHNLIETIYRKKGGDGDFNVVFVELTGEDIDFIENAIKNNMIDDMDMPGFFFGDGSYDDEDRKRDLEFVDIARADIDDGYRVYYYCWW